MTLQEDIVRRLERLKADIQGRMAAERENASGRTSASFRVISYDGGVKLVGGGNGCAPLATLEIGARPHYAPIRALTQWAKDKGLATTDKQAKSIAYAVRTKIAREGTDRFRNFANIYSALTDEAGKDVIKMATSEITIAITEQLKNL